MTAALKAGEVVELDSANTIADGTAVKEVGDQNLPYVQENVDDILLVEDDELIGAFLDMVENQVLQLPLLSVLLSCWLPLQVQLRSL